MSVPIEFVLWAYVLAGFLPAVLALVIVRPSSGVPIAQVLLLVVLAVLLWPIMIMMGVVAALMDLDAKGG